MDKKTAVQLLVGFLIVLYCSCMKDADPIVKETRVDPGCKVQYTIAKWIKKGDSVTVAVCPPGGGNPGKSDSVSFAYLGHDVFANCRECFELRLNNMQTGQVFEYSTSSGSEYESFWVWPMRYKIENVVGDSILFVMTYNTKK